MKNRKNFGLFVKHCKVSLIGRLFQLRTSKLLKSYFCIKTSNCHFDVGNTSLSSETQHYTKINSYFSKTQTKQIIETLDRNVWDKFSAILSIPQSQILKDIKRQAVHWKLIFIWGFPIKNIITNFWMADTMSDVKTFN